MTSSDDEEMSGNVFEDLGEITVRLINELGKSANKEIKSSKKRSRISFISETPKTKATESDKLYEKQAKNVPEEVKKRIVWQWVQDITPEIESCIHTFAYEHRERKPLDECWNQLFQSIAHKLDSY